jgi:CTP:molybdopterin cytidylyltransferase MocA
VIFDRSVFEDLRAADSSVGAKAVFARHRDRVLNVEVKDPGAFEDIDTPEDYEKVLGL